MNRASTSSGPSLLDKSKATPGSVDMSIFEKKNGGKGGSAGSGPVGQGTTSSDYLQKTREDNPEPNADNKSDSVTLGNCRITTDPAELAAEQPYEMTVDVKGPGTATTTGTVTFNLFCTLPKTDGTAEIKDLASPTQATVKDGKAVATGTLAAPDPAPEPGTKLHYHVVAHHPKASGSIESPKVDMESGKVPTPLAVWSLGAVHFGFDSSFILPAAVRKLAEFRKTFDSHPGAAAAVFGHADPIGDDDFKRRNPKTSPPADFYYMSYGDKYVRRFTKETSPILSEEGKIWLVDAKRRLQVAIENRLSYPTHSDAAIFEKQNNFRDFKSFAFSSHVDAYWLAGLYKLGTLDLVKISLTPDFKDLKSPEGIEQVEKIGMKFKDYWAEHPLEFAKRTGEALIYKDEIERLILEKAIRESFPKSEIPEIIHKMIYITVHL